MARSKTRWIDYLVYIGVRGIVIGVQCLPLRLAYALGISLARLARQLDRRHRQVAERNLEAAFPDLATDDRTRLLRQSYDHFGRMLIEMIKMPTILTVNNYRQYCTAENVQPVIQTRLRGRPAIIVTGHFGNWEMAGFLLGAVGLRSFAIARDLDNPYLHQFLLRFREYTGQTILSKKGDYARIEQTLAEGQLLVIVADQSAGERGPFVDFFGRPASTHKSIALLAAQFDAPIFVGAAYRDEDGFHYRVICSDAIEPSRYINEPDGITQLTQAFTTELERQVRRAPEQYFWLHHRWKHQPKSRSRRTTSTADIPAASVKAA